MIVTVEVKRETNESNASIIRRFSKRVGSAGIINVIKKTQFRERSISPFKKKKSALKRLERRQEFDRLKKLGQLPDVRRLGRKR